MPQNLPNFKTALINGAAGDIAVVAAVTGKKIAVHGYVMGMRAAGSLRWEDGAAGTALTGIIEMLADTPYACPFSPIPWFVGSTNTALSLEATTGGADGHIIYALID